uniref:DH domain-containing protein n=1 Tax=Anopheles atroparvus TaxID=41427 RepID=A0A182IWR8_ANOAO
MMMQSEARVVHQSAAQQVTPGSRQRQQQQQQHAGRNLPGAGHGGRPGNGAKALPPAPQQQYTKFRNNRSASSSRVGLGLGGLHQNGQQTTVVEAKVDCRRKNHARNPMAGGSGGLEEDGPFSMDRIPKMELLKVNYVNLKGEEVDRKKALLVEGERKKSVSAIANVSKSNLGGGEKAGTGGSNVNTRGSSATSSSSTPAPSSGQTGEGAAEEVQGKSKYLVYKKHNGFGANTPSATESGSSKSTTAGGKLQYINDSDIKMKASVKKKYAMLFDSKKKNKLETVQYYFDSRSYERYVDNKLYGVVNEGQKVQQESKSRPGSPGKGGSGEGQQKRLSWDVRQHNNRPSMMRVINQSAAAKKCANAMLLNQATAAAKPMSAEAPESGGGGLKQENCRMFKLQKSHTSTNFLTRHRSMNDIHRINQLFLESKSNQEMLDPRGELVLAPSVQRQNSSARISYGGQQKSSGSQERTVASPVVVTSAATSAARDPAPVHRFEKHRKTEQQKYLVHKRLSARYKTEDNLPNTVQLTTPPSPSLPVAASSVLSGEDTISKRIRQIIDGQDHIGSIETINQDEPDQVDTRQHKRRSTCHHGEQVRRLSRSKSAERLISDEDEDEEEEEERRSVKSSKTCGYKNCKFSNCPMSSSSSAGSSASSTVSTATCGSGAKINSSAGDKPQRSCLKSTADHRRLADQTDIVTCGKRTSIVIKDDDDVLATTPMTTTMEEVLECRADKVLMNNALNEKLNNSNNSNVHIVLSSKIKEIDLESNRIIIEKCVAPSQRIPANAGGGGGIATRQKFWNQQNQRNIKLKNNPQTKAYDDKININNKIKNEENNSIKIFISSNNQQQLHQNNLSCNEPVSLISTVTTNSNRSSICSSSSSSASSNSTTSSSCGSTGCESDKDDGYYDQSERSISPEKQQPPSIVSTISTDSSNSTSNTLCSESTNVSRVTCTNSELVGNRYTSKTSIRVGCDGSLFLNNGYIDETEGGGGGGPGSNSSPAGTGSNGPGDECCSSSNHCCCCRRRSKSSQSSFGLMSSGEVGGAGTIVECENDRTISAILNNGNNAGSSAGIVLRNKAGNCECGKSRKNVHKKIESFSPRPRSIDGPPDSGISISSDTVIASSDSDLNLQSQTDSDERKLKRGHVLAELLETERIYVAEMGSILRNEMKFGNYNLNSSTACSSKSDAAEPKRRRHLFLFRIGKVKSTANYIVGKVHRRLGANTRMPPGSISRSSSFSAGVEESVKGKDTTCAPELFESTSRPGGVGGGGYSETSSPLSYRASLFGEHQAGDSKLSSKVGELTMPRFSPRDFPISWSTPFDRQGAAGTLPLGLDGLRRDDAAFFQAFGSRAHLFHKNKSISGKQYSGGGGGLMFSKASNTVLQPAPYYSLKRSNSTLRRSAQVFGGSCPEIHAPDGDNGTLQSQKSHRSSVATTNTNHTGGRRFRKSKIVQLLERNEHDEKTEMAILQEYFDTMSYTEIVKDRDFRNYLMKKRYLDIMEYIYSNAPSSASDNGQVSRAPSTVVPPSPTTSNNDCDSVKKEKLLAETGPTPVPPPLPPLRRYYYPSGSNPQVFCRWNSNFERYYQNDAGSSYPGTTGFPGAACDSLPRTKADRPADLPPYVTLPKVKNPKPMPPEQIPDPLPKPSRCQRTYRQLREFCERSLMRYTLSRANANGTGTSAATLKLRKPAKTTYSEKEYRRVIEDFVRKRGFSNAEEYTRYHYGDFLRLKVPIKKKSLARKKDKKKIEREKQKQPKARKKFGEPTEIREHYQYLQYNSLPPPPYSSGDYHCAAPATPMSRESKATPPAARNQPTNLLLEYDEHADDTEAPSTFTDVGLLPNVCGLIYADSFKNFDYVNQARTMTLGRTKRAGSPASGRLDERQQIFRPVNSDGEEEQQHPRCSSPFFPDDAGVLLGAVIATSDETNRPYIFDDVGVYETIRSNSRKELLRAEVRSRKDTFISGRDGRKMSDPPRYRVAMGLKPPRFDSTRKSGYRDEMLSEEMSSLVPPGLQGKSDILFGNLHELYTFHNDIFLKDLENCISTTELVALCFVQRRDTFFRLYSYYCQNIPRSERLRETLVDTHLFLQECQKKLGHKLPLAAYLLKPVQRITKYQLLLKDLLKFSDTGTCSRELQKALDCMLVVLKCVNDSMHQIAITGFPADLSQQGELLLQDSFQVWTESKKDLRLRLKTQNRHIFLYQKAMLFCKQGSKTGHNKSTYQFKHWLQMSQIGLTESVRGDPRRFEVWLQGRQEVHTFQAGTIEMKNKWVAEIKRVLLNQLEELKGEKIKQYGLNHKPLRHTASWDVPQAMHGTPNRTLSCDQQAQSNGGATAGMVGLAQDVVTRIAHLNDDSLLHGAGISSSSSEHDNQETNAWSSDYSNSEDEFTTVEDSVVPGHKFVSLADYCAMGNSEVSMKETDMVELLKVGCAGWWFVKVLATGLEGWAPAAYLEPINRKTSRLRGARSQDKLNDH